MQSSRRPTPSPASDVWIQEVSALKDPRPPELPRNVLICWHPFLAYGAIATFYLYTALRIYCLLTTEHASLLMWMFLLAEWGIAGDYPPVHLLSISNLHLFRMLMLLQSRRFRSFSNCATIDHSSRIYYCLLRLSTMLQPGLTNF